MQKPNSNLIKELATIGVHVTDSPSVLQDTNPNKIGVTVEVLLKDVEVTSLPEFGIMTVSKRGVHFCAGNWRTRVTEDQKSLLVFDIYTYSNSPLINESIKSYPLIATSFIDLCWSVGVENLAQIETPDVGTPLNKEAKYDDLGWYLSSRVLDNLIDSLGKINDIFLNGALEEAILYGPKNF